MKAKRPSKQFKAFMNLLLKEISEKCIIPIELLTNTGPLRRKRKPQFVIADETDAFIEKKRKP